MKKLITSVLTVALVFAAGCSSSSSSNETEGETTTNFEKSEGTMTYAEFDAAAIGDEVVVEAFVQAKQSWWQNSAVVYAQDNDGGYLFYNLACTEEEYAKLVEGQLIKVTGYKAEWPEVDGEIEISDGTFELLDGNWVAPVTDVTSALGTDNLKSYINQKVSFKGLTIEAKEDGSAVVYSYDNSGTQGDDLYFDASIDGKTYTFTVESYLTDSSTDVYKAVEALNVGDQVDLEGFLYWYEGMNPHITSIVT